MSNMTLFLHLVRCTFSIEFKYWFYFSDSFEIGKNDILECGKESEKIYVYIMFEIWLRSTMQTNKCINFNEKSKLIKWKSS